MANEYNYGYKYDRCVSQGICSINPATSSLQEVIFLYLKIAAHYGLKLEEFGIKNKQIQNLVLNTISIISSNYEISAVNFNTINYAFKKELPEIIIEYENICKQKNKKADIIDTADLLKDGKTINDYIRLGEKEFNKRTSLYNSELSKLYKTLFILVKSFCINILIYESFNKEVYDEFSCLLTVLNLLNNQNKNKSDILNYIKDLAEKDCKLMQRIKEAKIEEYGEQEESEVSFSTTKGKAILVVGSNLRELEQILDKLKDTNIDIYTHDNMILAHTFPKFKQYKHLKGQFGQGIENCLLDFSTFPGPIILTRNSLYNVENLYRGRLYTTDFAYSKGVIPIKNNDFSDVIKSADESKGFKTGKACRSEVIGFSYNEIINKVHQKLQENIFDRIFIIGIDGTTQAENEYFKNLINHIPDNVFVLSMSCCKETENRICLNAMYDTISVIRLSENLIKNSKQKVSLFFPFCDRHTLSAIIYISSLVKDKIFIGKWNNSIINPNITDVLKEEFSIEEISTPKQDMLKIIPE